MRRTARRIRTPIAEPLERRAHLDATPIVTPVGPFDVLRGTTRAFPLGVTGTSTLDVTVDFGPSVSTTTVPATNGSVPFTYTASGIYHVTVDASDAAGTVHTTFDVRVHDVQVRVNDDVRLTGMTSNSPLADVPVALDLNANQQIDAGEPQQTTNASGDAWFDQPTLRGTVRAIVTPPSDRRELVPAAQGTATESIGARITRTLSKTTAINATAFDDINGDGIKQGTEPSRRVYVDLDNDGRMEWDEPFAATPVLPAGTYTLRLLSEHSNQPTASLPSHTITVAAHDVVFMQPIIVSNPHAALVKINTFIDTNGDGIQQAGESTQSGGAFLYDVTQFSDGFDPERQAGPDGRGDFPNSLAGLPLGDVTLRPIALPGSILTTPADIHLTLDASSTDSTTAPTVTIGIQNVSSPPRATVANAWIDTSRRVPSVFVQFTDGAPLSLPFGAWDWFSLTQPSGRVAWDPAQYTKPAYRAYNPLTRTLEITIDPAILTEDGLYTLKLPGFGPTSSVPYIGKLRFVRGDANNDGRVDFTDLLTLARNYGKTGQTIGTGNVDMDPTGSVDFSDLLMLARNYGVTIAQPAAALAPPVASSTRRTPASLVAPDVLA